MKRLSTVIEKEIAEKFEQKAKGMGLTPAGYLRNIINADLKRQEDILTFKDLQKSITALIPAIVEGICKINRIKPDQVKTLTKICYNAWEESFRNEKS